LPLPSLAGRKGTAGVRYLRDRWNFGRTYAYRLIAAADVVRDLARAGLPPPASEHAARPLAPLPREERARVWEQAMREAGCARPSAARVEQLARAALGRPAPPPASAGRATGHADGLRPLAGRASESPSDAATRCRTQTIQNRLGTLGILLVDP
jgi:hypothetical protein